MATRLENVTAERIVDFDVDDPSLAGCVHERLADIREEILGRIPDFAVDPRREPRYHARQVRGVQELPLVFTPQAAGRER